MLKKVLVVSCIVISLCLLWKSGLKNLMHSIEMLTYDWRTTLAVDGGSFSLGGTFRSADDNIVLLAADNNTFDKLGKYSQLGLGRWPWPRKTWADVIDYIEQGHPKAIVLDLSFEGEEGFAPVNKESDDMFANALKRYDNITVGLPLTNKRLDILNINREKLNMFSKDYLEKSISRKFQQDFTPVQTGININYNTPLEPEQFDNTSYYNHAPVPLRFLKNTNFGCINVDDIDGSVIRYNVPFYRILKDNKVVVVPSLALSAVLNMENVKNINFENNTYSWKDNQIPVDEAGRVLINWHGRKETYRTLSLIDLFLGKALLNKQIDNVKNGILPETFKDKIVVIGQTATGTDIQSTPFGSYPGPEINATLIDNYLHDTNLTETNRRKFVTKANWAGNYFVIVLLCLAVAYCNLKNKSYLVNITLFLSSLVVFVLGSLYLFSLPWSRVWINMTYTTIFILITSLGTFLYRVMAEQQNKKNIIDVFGKFVAPQILSDILRDTGHLNNVNKRKFMTVLFADIKGFTSIAESTQPDILSEQLNEFFDNMVEVVLKNNGTIDKFIGDAMMAFWGDPVENEEHAFWAVKSAIEMKNASDEINKKRVAKNMPPFELCLGINSGDMIVGYMGSSKIVDYTVIGDNVNVASRLEGLNRAYNTRIIISEATYELVKDKINTRYLDETMVKGKSKAVKVYEVLDEMEKLVYL